MSSTSVTNIDVTVEKFIEHCFKKLRSPWNPFRILSKAQKTSVMSLKLFSAFSETPFSTSVYEGNYIFVWDCMNSSKTVFFKSSIHWLEMWINTLKEYCNEDRMNPSLYPKLKMQIFNGLIAIFQLIFSRNIPQRYL